MERSGFAEVRMIGLLRERGSGVRAADVRRGRGVSEATVYEYETAFAGMVVSDAGRPKVPGDEDAKPQTLLSDGCSTVRF